MIQKCSKTPKVATINEQHFSFNMNVSNQKQMHIKNGRYMCIVQALITLIALLLILFKYFIENYSNLKVKEFDLDTVTVGDWSVELEISDKQYDLFKNKFYKNQE